MSVFWRCADCKRYNTFEKKECQCGGKTTCGFLVKVTVDNVTIRKFFKDFEVAKVVNAELEKRKELSKLARKLRGVDEGLARTLGLEEEEKGRWIKLKVFWAKYYQWLVTQKKPSTLKERVSRWRKVIKPILGEETLTEITPQAIFRLQRELLERGKSSSHVNRTVAMIRHMLSLAVKWGYLKEHPLKGRIEMLRERKDRWTFITQDQYLAIRGRLSETYLDLYDFLVFTGARLGEALSLRWRDILWDTGVAYLGDSKANRPRVLYLSDFVLEMLQRRRKKVGGEDEERVFQHSDSEFRRAFKRALREAGLPSTIRIHDLRHTFASWLAMKGEPLQHIKELLGHSQISTTLRYAHLMPATLRQAVNDLVSGIPSGKRSGEKGRGKIVNMEQWKMKKMGSSVIPSL